MAEQLILSHLRPRPDARLGDFAGDSYAALVAAAEELLRSGGLLYVHGGAGTGRSHLLAALCAAGEQQGLQTVMVPLSDLTDASPDILRGLEEADLVLLDDLQAMAGRREWEESLFHLVNRCRAVGGRMAFAADSLPRDLGLVLPDLLSRLAQAPSWAMGVPDDASRERLIAGAALRRGWVLEPDVLRYLVARVPREPGRLLVCLEELDRRSLQEGRRLTIPFVREWLDLPADRRVPE